MRQRLLGVLLAGVACAAPASAQGRPATPSDTNPALAAYRRAQRLVNDGYGGPGRFIIDSLVEVAEPGSPAEAQALVWRATLAPTWVEAQRDYLRVMLEHERAPLAAESMFRLAQGELAGGDRPAAERYLERLAREAPEAPIRGEASLWHGRMLVERGARAAACPILREGRQRVHETHVELRDQYEALLQGCLPPATPAPTPVPATASTAAAPAGAAMGAPPSKGPRWSVQLAAYPTRAEAEAMLTRLRGRGYGDLRIDGEAAPFRVRMGRFATREAAQRALTAYRTTERADAFVTAVAPP